MSISGKTIIKNSGCANYVKQDDKLFESPFIVFFCDYLYLFSFKNTSELRWCYYERVTLFVYLKSEYTLESVSMAGRPFTR